MNIINLGIVAHVDAGKTTLTEAMLHVTGASRRLGRVDHGDTTTDYLDVERQRGITVRASTVSFECNDTKVNILDTPGHMDFIAEVERSLTVLDAAVLVISAREGVQSQTRVLWHALSTLGIPTVIFINKLDRLGADVTQTISQIHSQLTHSTLLRQHIDGASVRTLALEECDGLNDILFEADEVFASAYLNNEQISPGFVSEAYLRSVRNARLYPVYAGIALDEVGVTELLDAITTELPFANEPCGSDFGSAGCSALIYKLEFHTRFGAICYARIYAGEIVMRRTYNVFGTEHSFRVTQLYTPQAGQIRPVGSVTCGDIAVLPVKEFFSVGAVIGDFRPPVKAVSLAEPMLSVRVAADPSISRETLISVLKQLCLEDPLLSLSVNEQTGALELRVFGRVQMEILTQLGKERYGLDLNLTQPQTIFRERPMRKATGDVHWSDTGYEAAVGVEIEPLDEGSGVEYVTEVDYGYLQTPFQNAMREGVMSMLRHGIYGWELTDIRVTIKWAQYSSVTSTPSDYRKVAPAALLRALHAADTELMEPMLAYILSVPEDKSGRAIYDLGMMRGTITDTHTDADTFTVEGIIPLHASKDYSQDVASYTKGMGVFAVRGAGYAIYGGDKAAVVNQGYELPSFDKYLLMLAGRI